MDLKKEKKEADCQNCQYCDYDDEYGDWVCSMDMDEDDLVRVMERGASSCPYYRLYDEYGMVRKQN